MPYAGYSGWIVQLDPSGADMPPGTTRTMLDINNPSTGIQIGGTSSGDGIDWGTAQITEMLAQEGQWGSAVADYIVPNRTVVIPLALGMGGPGTPTANEALANLAEKVGLIQREGGWLLRQREGASALYLDVVDAQLQVPDAWGETADVEPNVTLTLICLPDFYGSEVALDSIPCTGFCTGVFTASGSQAVISGDYPARCRVVVADTSGNQQDGLVWGVQSRYYNAATTQALSYSASALTTLNGASTASNASGYTGTVVKVEPPVASVWWPFLGLELSGGTYLAHQGTYRVLVRAMSATEAPELQLSWGSPDSSALTTNTAVQVPVVDGFCVLDLGIVRIDAPPVGSNAWIGLISAQVATANDDVQVDEVWLVPLDEAAGSLCALSSSGSTAVTTSAAPTGFAGSGWSAGYGLLSAYYDYSLSGGGTASTLLVCTGLGFAVPSGATIVGVTLEIDKKATSNVYDVEVMLYSGGTTIGSNRASSVKWATGTAAATTYGGAADTWGASLTRTIVNSSGFGFAISAESNSVPPAATAYVYAQSATVTVYYTLGSFSLTSDAVIYADETLELTDKGAYRTADGTVYAQASTPLGDLTRIPPSGLEDRPVRFFVKPMRGQFSNGSATDNGIDTFTVTPYYRPCSMFRP